MNSITNTSVDNNVKSTEKNIDTYTYLKSIKRLYTKNGKRFRAIHKKRTKLKDYKGVLALFACFFVLFFTCKSNMIAYFTDIKNISNLFSIEAQYTVSFNGNTGTGSMAGQVISYNVGTALNTNSFTKDGYIFDGWNTEPDGTGTPYTDGESVMNLEDITLYAQWIESEECTITFAYGDETFVGNNYINSGIPLFNSNNIHRDYEVSVDVSNFTFLPNQDQDRNVLICNQYERKCAISRLFIFTQRR